MTNKQLSRKLRFPLLNGGYALAALFFASGSILAANRAPAAVACDQGQVIGIQENAKIVLCSQSSHYLPMLSDQLDRLTQLAEKNERQQENIQRFIQQINTTGKTIGSNKQPDLTTSVAALLAEGKGKSDAQVLESLKTLSRRIEDLQDKIDQSSTSTDSKARINTALNGDLGDALAHLNIDKANGIVSSLDRIETKIDEINNEIKHQNEQNAEAKQQVDLEYAIQMQKYNETIKHQKDLEEQKRAETQRALDLAKQSGGFCNLLVISNNIASLVKVDSNHFDVIYRIGDARPGMLTISTMLIGQDGKSGQFQPDYLVEKGIIQDTFTFNPKESSQFGYLAFAPGTINKLARIRTPGWFKPGTFTLSNSISGSKIDCVWE